jgi:hypothetical protein
MPDESHRVLLGYRGRLYRFATLVLSHSDGSLYLHLTREGKSPTHWHFELFSPGPGLTDPIEVREERRRDVDISYHPTGLIRYKHVSNKPIYAEPLNLITKHFCFAKYSVPSIDKLDPATKRAGDTVFPIPDEVEGRVTFSWIVSPLADPRVTGDVREFGMNILFGALFSINCVADRSPVPLPLPPDLQERAFVFISPVENIVGKLALSKDQASILFHQLLTGTTRLFVYPPNPEGENRVVFATEMYRIPDVIIKFADPHHVAEITRSTKGSAWFKVRDGKGHVVKHPVQITSIELSAEL